MSTWRRKVGVVTAALTVLLVTGCGGDDSDSRSPDSKSSNSDGPADEALVDCAIGTHRLREAMVRLDEAVNATGGIRQGEYGAGFALVLDEYGSSAEPLDACPSSVSEAYRSALDAFQGAEDAFDSCTKKCSSEQEGNIVSGWATASANIEDARDALGEEAIDEAESRFVPTPLDLAFDECLTSVKAGDYASAAIEYMSLRDQGKTLAVHRPGDFDTREPKVVSCLLDALDAPAAVLDLMNSTTALMGRQDYAWEELEVVWSYHPDSGLDALFTTAP